jgi:hypothetical protein
MKTTTQLNHLAEYKERARTAHNWTSFDPEKRGKRMIEDYDNALTEDLKEIEKATEEEKERYIAGFKTRFSDWLSAKSRCASSAITGGSGFNVSRAEKANNSEHNKCIEMGDYRERVVKAILKKIENRRPQADKDAERLKGIEKSILSTAQTIIDIDEGRNTYSARSLFTSALTSFIKRMAKNGQVNEVIFSLDIIEKLNENSVKPIITKRSSIWKLRESVKEVAEKKEGLKNAEDKVYLYEGFKVVASFSDQRLRIVHDEKPSREVIDNIKKHGFKWSRFNTAWQRKLTQNAVYTTFKIMLKDVKQLETA